MLRSFHKLLCDKLGVMLPENIKNKYGNKYDGDASTDSNRFAESNLNIPLLTHPSDTLSLASFGPAYPSDELQAALAQIPLIPPDMGHPEEGSGTPPWILRFLWSLIVRKPTLKETSIEVNSNEKNESTAISQFERSGK
ncbi:unnamed protein product, partial [Trichobilharzia regenti]